MFVDFYTFLQVGQMLICMDNGYAIGSTRMQKKHLINTVGDRKKITL